MIWHKLCLLCPMSCCLSSVTHNFFFSHLCSCFHPSFHVSLSPHLLSSLSQSRLWWWTVPDGSVIGSVPLKCMSMYVLCVHLVALPFVINIDFLFFFKASPCSVVSRYTTQCLAPPLSCAHRFTLLFSYFFRYIEAAQYKNCWHAELPQRQGLRSLISNTYFNASVFAVICETLLSLGGMSADIYHIINSPLVLFKTFSDWWMGSLMHWML